MYKGLIRCCWALTSTIPRGPTYRLLKMEIGLSPNHNKDGLSGPNSIMVVSMPRVYPLTNKPQMPTIKGQKGSIKGQLGLGLGLYVRVSEHRPQEDLYVSETTYSVAVCAPYIPSPINPKTPRTQKPEPHT